VRGFKLHHYPAIALVVYQKPGLALLRKAWFNLDLVWAVALIDVIERCGLNYRACATLIGIEATTDVDTSERASVQV
jgi:hypothetical protein